MKKHNDTLLRIMGFAYDNREDMHMLVFEIETSLDKRIPDSEIVRECFEYIEVLINEGWADFYDPVGDGTTQMDTSRVAEVIQERWKDIDFALPDQGDIICFTLTAAGKAKYQELSDRTDR